MPYQLDQVVLWGRSLNEYRLMFGLAETDLKRRILGVGDGPASFNAKLTARGGDVVSIDPIYAFAREQIAARIDVTYSEVMDQLRQNQADFVWQLFSDPEAVSRERRRAMDAFLADYDAGRAAGRYCAGALPSLDVDDNAFDLALCSHFLFLYSDQFALDFHIASVRELCRVAREVRIFPLLALGSIPSPHVEPVREALEADGHAVEIVAVDYEFQRGGNEMMEIRKANC